jgi:dinuclear metal center YbgI/SA1388 family protein
MKVKDIIQHLEAFAPPIYQESYDNSGLIVGDLQAEVTGVMICLDSVEEVLDEAAEKGCNLVVAHHPIVFRGLKRLTGRNYVERVVMKAIKQDIAIYAIHTNLDNIRAGVNARIAEKLDLQDTRILSPKAMVKKLFAFVPASHADMVKNALFRSGAGISGDTVNISYASVGAASANDWAGPQIKLESSFAVDKQSSVVSALKSVVPDAQYDIVAVEAKNQHVGSGMIGQLPKETDEEKFLKSLKKTMGVGCVRHTALLGKKIKTVAVCGGSGGFLLNAAVAKGADVFITADYKYHEFFDADGRIVIADIGHFESEQFTIDLLHEILTEKFTTFAVQKTTVNTNPVHYL